MLTRLRETRIIDNGLFQLEKDHPLRGGVLIVRWVVLETLVIIGIKQFRMEAYFFGRLNNPDKFWLVAKKDEKVESAEMLFGKIRRLLVAGVKVGIAAGLTKYISKKQM